MQAICISVSFFRVICIIHLFLVVFCVTIASVTQNCEAFSSKHEITVDFLMNDWIPVQESKRCACNITCRFFTVPPQTGLEKPSWKYPTNHDVVIMMHYLHTFADGERVRDFPEQIFGYLELEPPISGHAVSPPEMAKIQVVDPNNGRTRYAFDWKLSYQRDSDVLVSYVDELAPGFNRYGISFANKSNDYFALLMASNCQQEAEHRLEYTRMLMESGIRVISLGKCMHSHDSTKLFPDCHRHGDERGDKKCIISKFKFYLAFENSRFDDYVTEKFWEVLDVGTIPVYRGAPNIKQLVPNAHSAIFADDFDTPKDLADYMKLVGNNQQLYDEYFDWKEMPLSPEFVRLYKNSWRDVQCNICEYYSKYRRSKVNK